MEPQEVMFRYHVGDVDLIELARIPNRAVRLARDRKFRERVLAGRRGIDSERLGGIFRGAWHLWLGEARSVGVSGQAVFLVQPDQDAAHLGIVELQVVQLDDDLPGLPRYSCEYAWHLSQRSKGAEPLSDLHNQLLGNIRLRVDCRGLLRILRLRVNLQRPNEHAQREHECNDGRPHCCHPPRPQCIKGASMTVHYGAPTALTRGKSSTITVLRANPCMRSPRPMRETKACIQGSLVLRRSRATPSLAVRQGESMNSREAVIGKQAREVAPVLAPEQE